MFSAATHSASYKTLRLKALAAKLNFNICFIATGLIVIKIIEHYLQFHWHDLMYENPSCSSPGLLETVALSVCDRYIACEH